MNSTEQEGEQAFNIKTIIEANELQRRILLGKNIVLLKTVKKGNLQRIILGDDDADFVAYLGQVETMYSRNEIYNYIRIHDKFVEELNLNFEDICDIPVSRLIELVPIVSDDRLLSELLEQARSLTNQDFRDVVRRYKGLPVTDDGHEHKMVEYVICSECGIKHKTGEHESSKV